MNMENFKWDKDADGIVTITWDMPGRSMNVLSNSSTAEMGKWIEAVAKDDSIKGVVLTSGKPAFCAGADLGEMEGNADGAAKAGATTDPEAALRARLDGIMNMNRLLRTLETCGKPIVAAINGTALGGGLEVTLACHNRIASDNPRTQLGLPESKVGLLPGAGGTQRLPRMIGAANALPLILQGTSLNPQAALKAGVVSKVVPESALIAEAKRWIKESPSAVQPWDEKGFKVPGGQPNEKGAAQVFTMGNAMLRKTTYGNYPAQLAIMKCVYEGLCVPIDTALRIEARHFLQLMGRPEAKAMIRSLFLSMQELGKGARRPQDQERKKIEKLGVLGAGVMGAGVAYVSAKAGMQVVLLDRDQAAADKGKDYSANVENKAIEKGRSNEAKRDEILGRILPTADYDDLKGCDLIIEAVFEDREIKADVTKKTEAVVGADCIFGSNTSTLPITELSEASERPESFIGIHFFSPVERMGLVEIICGKKTSDEALARAIDYTMQIRKTPIVVNDSRGFYTSRSVGTFVNEGVEMLKEGISPVLIENAARMSGMPMGALELFDSVGIDTALKIRRQTRKDLDIAEPDDGEAFMAWIVEECGRPGRKTGKGFYDYNERGSRGSLWPDLMTRRNDWNTSEDVEILKKRFLYRQAVEAVRCVEENVVTDPRDADIGAILGWGFAPFTGGPLSLIDAIGTDVFLKEITAFAKKYGEGFKPPKLLKEMAKNGESFYGRFGKAEKKAA